MQENYIIVIPARYKSSRLPAKPLKKILGKELVIRVAEICKKVVTKNKIWIATDNRKIFNLARKNNFNSIMTNKNHKNGTERICEVSRKIKAKFYINVQGDEPLINPSDIKKAIDAKKKFKNQVINCCKRIKNKKEKSNVNVPKIVFNDENNLLYATRGSIPQNKKGNNIIFHKQVCIYAYNRKELKIYEKFKKSKLEKIEDIEILRFLESNIKVKMINVKGGSQSVDTPQDLKKVTKLLKKKYEF